MSSPPKTGPVTAATAAELLERLYGLTGAVEALPGERDRNFRITAPTGSFVLKVHGADADPRVLDLQNRALEHIARSDRSLPVQRVVPSRNGDETPRVCVDDGSHRWARLLTWIPGTVWAEAGPYEPSLVASLGTFVARVDRALADFEHPAMQRPYRWGMQFAAECRELLPLIDDGVRRAMAADLLARFAHDIGPRLAACRAQVIHNDASERNILVGPERTVVGLIDFGDLMYSPTVCGVAVGCAYAMLGSELPVEGILPLVAAYDEVIRLTDTELELLFDLVETRLAMSMCMAAWQSQRAPENEYLLVSQQSVWELLQRLRGENRHLAHFRFRDVCGREPNPSSRAIVNWMEVHSDVFAGVTRHDLATVPRLTFDFTAGSEEAARLEVLPDVAAITEALFDRMQEKGAVIGIGRYLENRAWYRAPQFAVPRSSERRMVHLGVDLFLPVGEPIYAPLDGVVHACANNAREGDYGPVIVLEHATDDGVFWTLYGHLSLDSLDGLSPGSRVEAGDMIGHIGDSSVNGNWAPHLHFQVLTHTLDLGCDVDGVAAPSAIDVWQSVSPDPNLMLRIPEGCRASVPREREYHLLRRRQFLGPSLSLSYAEPLAIVRGEGQFLYDADGRAYLDMVNNVCHVGHCHPRVVRAGQEQMARLNTNTRYLSDALIEYARRLVATFPEPLAVCYVVNSGSEANDLALRMARAHSGQRGVVVLDQAYHGHLTSLVEISPYKFNGPGGSGRPPHVGVSVMPDGYRGPFKYADPQCGERYARAVAGEIESLRADGWGLAAFFAESAISCGGQIILPPRFLAETYAHVRDCGGVCVADEVQVGLGRVGTHMWAFETQGVVPDIVTLGKPLGNGHPLAAVITTPEIAASFANGMEYFNTFGGNPVSAAIGLAVLDVIRDERLRHNASRMGRCLMDGLRALGRRYPLIGDVRGLGLFIGVELVRDRVTQEPADAEATAVIERAKDLGVLLAIDGPHRNVLKIKPPMRMREEHCTLFLSVLDEVLKGVDSAPPTAS